MENGTDDLKLVAAACDGDKKAYGDLVGIYQKRLFRFVYMMLGRRDTTEDIVQEAFVKGYLALSSFERSRPFYPWISTIARNLALNFIKRSEREKTETEIEHDFDTLPAKIDNPHDELIEKENDRKLAGAVKALPEVYRTVFVLRMFEKLSYEEIAEKLNITLGTVNSRLFRAREKLLEMLKEQL